MKKNMHELKAKFVYLYMTETKNNSFDTSVFFFKAYKKCKSSILK